MSHTSNPSAHQPQADDQQDTFDIAVIGSGPGGYSVALRSAQLGASVALIERDPVVGGTCLNRGCIPTKALLSATQTIAESARAREVGVKTSYEGIDFAKLNAFKQASVEAMTGGLQQLLEHRRVTLIHGSASITGQQELTVQLAEGGSRRIQATDIVLATGSRSTALENCPFSDNVLDSDRALALEEFPQNPVIIGSGAVAIEFASIWQAAGSQVSLLIRKNRVLSQWSERTSLTLTRELSKQGITIVDGAQADRIEQVSHQGTHNQGKLVVHYSPLEGSKTAPGQLEADKVLVAIGRTPNTDADWLAQAGVDTDSQGQVATDPWGRTSAEHIWALGDITAGYHFAHRAFEQGIVLAESIAGLDPQPVNEATIPQVVFSTPQAACVGYTKASAQASGLYEDISETVYPMLSNARVRMSGQGSSLSLVTAVKAGKNSHRILIGVHMVAPEATELIAEAEQLVGNQIPVSQAARLIHPHPTFSETLGEALLKADGRPLNMR